MDEAAPNFVCSNCERSFLEVKKLLSHIINEHKQVIFHCGIYGCKVNNLGGLSLRKHLYLHHARFYSENYVEPQFYFTQNSFFKLLKIPLLSKECSDASNIVDFTNLSINSSESYYHSNTLGQYDEQICDFLKLLVKNGCRQNASFKMISSMAISMIEFFKNDFNNDLCVYLKDSLKNQETFDYFLEKYFLPIFQL